MDGAARRAGPNGDGSTALLKKLACCSHDSLETLQDSLDRQTGREGMVASRSRRLGNVDSAAN